MIEQYPHYLFIHVVYESVQDEDGNWSTPVDSWELHSKCRQESNGKGQLIYGVDGKAIVFAATVYMPKSTAKITELTEVRICKDEDPDSELLIQAAVLKFSEGQLNCRLWV